MIEKFPKKLRPYTDKEIPEAMQRIAAHPYFPAIAQLIFPDISSEEAIRRLLSLHSIEEFQLQWMYNFNRRVIETTMDTFTYHVSPHIQPGKGYLYVSNHRDIILDSSLLQMVFVESRLPTSMITYGDNLIINQLARDLARSNKMFKVVRQGNKRELFKNSIVLSDFIRTCIAEGHSCWIAQRNGRTKDGLDQTSQALVKMLAMSGSRKDPLANYAELNIVPVSISYEYEPCDFLKTRELLMGRLAAAAAATAAPATGGTAAAAGAAGGTCAGAGAGAAVVAAGVGAAGGTAAGAAAGAAYVKQEGEDLLSIATGITQWKGNVHIHIGDPITKEELEGFYEEAQSGGANNEDFNAFAAHVCTLIDKAIAKGYKIFPTSHIAYDLLHGAGASAALLGSAAGSVTGFAAGSAAGSASVYTPEQKAEFMKRLEVLESGNIPLIPETELAASIPFDEDFPGGKTEGLLKKQAELIQKHHDIVRELFLGIYANPLIQQK
ncbi:MAG: hypothetical protein GX877_01730 [Bacteroidales bacterium]|nr:hypothetical protein [Bacteroidales bacterium]